MRKSEIKKVDGNGSQEQLRKIREDAILKAAEAFVPYNTDVQKMNAGPTQPRPGRITYQVMDEMYRRCSLLSSVVDTIVYALASLDWDITPKRFVEVEPREAEPLRELISRPNKFECRTSFFTQVLRDLMVYDTLAIEIVRVGGKIKELYPVDASTVIPIVDEHKDLLGYKQRVAPSTAYYGLTDSQQGPFKNEADFAVGDLIYFHARPATNRLPGFSRLESLQVEVATDLYAMNYNGSYFVDGHMFSKMLLLGDLGPDEMKKLRAHFDSKRGQSNQLPIVSIPDGNGKLLDFSNEQKDMAFTALDEWLFKRICAVFQLTASEVMELKHFSTKASAETQFKITEHRAFRPILKMLEEEINRWVIDQIDPRFEFHFDPGRLSEDERYKIMLSKIEAGVPVNMVLEEDGRDTIDFQMEFQGQMINPFDLPFSNTYLTQRSPDQVLSLAQKMHQDKLNKMRKDAGHDAVRRKLKMILGRKLDVHRTAERRDRLEKQLTPIFKKLVDAVISQVEQHPPETGKTWGFGPEVLKRAQKDWMSMILDKAFSQSDFEKDTADILDNTLRDSALDGSNSILAELGARPDSRFVSEWINDYLKKRFYSEGILKKITDTQRRQIAGVLDGLYKEGSGLPEYIDALRKHFDGLKDWQIMRVARTEDFLANTKAQKETWKDLGVEKFDFVTVGSSCGLCRAIAHGGSPLDYDPEYPNTDAAAMTFKGNPYTASEMNAVTERVGFGDGLPHPNCEDAWTASSSLSSEDEDKVVAAISKLAEAY